MAEPTPEPAFQLARERADKRLDSAITALRDSARAIATAHGIPEGISGHSVEELLGRMAYIPSMARDLRRAAGQELAKQELASVLRAAESLRRPAEPERHAPPIDPSRIPAPVPIGLDITDLSGITVQMQRALKAAGLNTVGDVYMVPDEHLLKISGIAEKSVQQLRAAIAKASQPKGPPQP